MDFTPPGQEGETNWRTIAQLILTIHTQWCLETRVASQGEKSWWRRHTRPDPRSGTHGAKTAVKKTKPKTDDEYWSELVTAILWCSYCIIISVCPGAVITGAWKTGSDWIKHTSSPGCFIVALTSRSHRKVDSIWVFSFWKSRRNTRAASFHTV